MKIKSLNQRKKNNIKKGTSKNRKVDYLKINEAKMDFGKKCEEIVYKYEINRLINEGRQEEAKNVKWISRDIGDGYGYDIEASENLKDRYYIYRVGKANTKNPEFYKIRGNVRDNFELETKVYLARVKENKKY